MLRVTNRNCKETALLASVGLALVAAVNSRAANPTNPSVTSTPPGILVSNAFPISSLTLTGNPAAAALMSGHQALAELKQGIQLSIAEKNYQKALEYAKVGLQVSPTDFEFLSTKAVALAKLHQYTGAIDAAKDALAVEPGNPDAVYGLAELLLITDRLDEYRKFAASHRFRIDAAYGGALAKYFSALEAYRTANEDKFRGVVAQTVAAFPATTGSLLPGWGFDDVLFAISQQPNTAKRAILLTLIRFLN